MTPGSIQFDKKLSTSIAGWFEQAIKERLPGEVPPEVIIEALTQAITTQLGRTHESMRIPTLENIVTEVMARIGVRAIDTADYLAN